MVDPAVDGVRFSGDDDLYGIIAEGDVYEVGLHAMGSSERFHPGIGAPVKVAQMGLDDAEIVFVPESPVTRVAGAAVEGSF